jgi:lycopene beta-cyclase
MNGAALGSTHDVVIVGDGPAGRALGAACVGHGIDAVVVGDDRRWVATYGAFADEVTAYHGATAATMAVDAVGTPPRRRLDRDYQVFDNERLKAMLDVAQHRPAIVTGIQHLVGAEVSATVQLDDGDRLGCRIAVDASGPTPALLARRRAAQAPAFQSAYGLVVEGRPDVGGDAAVLMDWRPPSPDAVDEPTFLYLVEVGAGRWLVEETSLARARPMPAAELRRRLAARLGRDLTDSAEHVEHVVIPMWSGVPARSQPTIGFGAAAGYVHPATGYSIAASLAAADRVAAAAASALSIDDPSERSLAMWNAVWPGELRRARALHDYGLAALLRLPTPAVQSFFDAFFGLPTEQWSAYLRVHTTAAEVARAMTGVFSSVPWSVRRRLAAGSPAAFARLLG